MSEPNHLFVTPIYSFYLIWHRPSVEAAANGSEGLTRLTAAIGTAADFDFVLCDFQMPVRAMCPMQTQTTGESVVFLPMSDSFKSGIPL